LVDMVANIGGKRIGKRHNLNAPQGVRGRNSDNARLREVLGWEPEISLEEGLRRTYLWIEEQVRGRAHPQAGSVSEGERRRTAVSGA
jgi:GDP-D-mannose 3',5'-epimerase